jgi:DNA adenine methylase
VARYRTPLRYPGGKQRLAPFIDEILECNGLVGGHYAEPYAGGAGIAMELLLSDRVSRVHLNDASVHVCAFWSSLVKQPDELCRRIAVASLSIDDWKRHRDVVRHPEDHDELDLGFSTFFLNRCNRSGILTGGVIGGLRQTGRWRIDARFPRNALIQRVEAIATKAHCISVTNLDAEAFMRGYAAKHLPGNSLVYCDPPYYERAERLYLNVYQPSDHARLAETIQGTLGCHWIVSYDGHPDVIALYSERRHFDYDLSYSATRAYTGREVMMFSDELALPATTVIPALREGLSAVA